MTNDELLDYISKRELNSKTNNLIIIGNDIENIIKNIPDKSNISFIDDELDIDSLINIKIDLSKTKIEDILSFSLDYMKKIGYIDSSNNSLLPFNNKFDINKFSNVLQDNNRVVSLIFYNMDYLSLEDQFLFNELYYFNSLLFNIISLNKNEFKTYFLKQDRVLDDRENFQKIYLTKSYSLSKSL